ncbi:MAG: TraR/DksA family transcriptional regulator [Chitinophagaceae bacterium]|nr:TraR/DksA family transcriptional regulator [Chitinophagaceae bacterium]MCB9054584.1 TraR/DksA family transcriptional regulator [Chitinophagales bacterium]
MATKKKQAAKKPAKSAGKASKPAKKAAAKKPAAKKTVKKTTSKPVKKAAKKAVKKVAVKKAAPKKAAPAAKKAAKPAKKAAVKKAAVATKPAAKKTAKKPGSVDASALVSIKKGVKPVIKKEPVRSAKVVIPKTTAKGSVRYQPEFTKSVLDEGAKLETGPTMRYSDSDLAEFREIIQRKLDAAKKELSYLQGLITRKEEGGDMDEGRYMTMEDGSVSMEREQLSQMASRQITFIDHLEKALMRIENKTYGICRVTGRLIDKARLRAVPHATLSIEAKQLMSK